MPHRPVAQEDLGTDDGLGVAVSFFQATPGACEQAPPTVPPVILCCGRQRRGRLGRRLQVSGAQAQASEAGGGGAGRAVVFGPALVGGSGGGRCRRAKAAERAERGADAKVGGAAKEERVEGRGQARTSRRARAPGAAGGARGSRASAVVDPAEGAGGARPSTAEPAAAAAASPVHGLPTVKLRALLERAGLETQGSREEVAARAEAAAARGELALPTEKQRDKTRRVATRTGRAAKRAPREEL